MQFTRGFIPIFLNVESVFVYLWMYSKTNFKMVLIAFVQLLLLDPCTFKEPVDYLASSDDALLFFFSTSRQKSNAFDLIFQSCVYIIFSLISGQRLVIPVFVTHSIIPALPTSLTASGSLPVCHVVEREFQQKVNLNCCNCASAPPGLYLIIQTRPISLSQLNKHGKWSGFISWRIGDLLSASLFVTVPPICLINCCSRSSCGHLHILAWPSSRGHEIIHTLRC